MAVFLVCEGERNGLDVRVLNALVVQPFNLSVQIEPAGGGEHIRAACSYLRARNDPPDSVVSVRDRDHSTPFATADASWSAPRPAHLFWRSHELENYLVAPNALLTLFDYYRSKVVPWAGVLPADPAGVTALLRQVADPLLIPHAAEVLKAELFVLARNSDLRFAPSPPAGAAARTQAGWLSALQKEAVRLRQSCEAVRVLPDFQPTNIDSRLAALTAQFTAPHFLQSGEYLRELAGKELLKCLHAHLRHLGALPKVSNEQFENDWVESVVRGYQPGVTFQPDCFQQLATILAQY